jgi:ribose transport system substrate-binding protein
MVGRWSAAIAAGALLLTAACVNPGTARDNNPTSPTATQGGHKRIAFFGFAKANSFASATFAGIEEHARSHDASAEFFDGNFDAQTQVRQIQDAITAKRFEVFVVQANDGAAVQPAVRAALDAGITVVVQFTPVGPRYDTAEPQVPGSITLIDVPVDNGRALAQLGAEACRSKNVNPCKVVYLEGFKSLPLDNARTNAVEDALKAVPGVQLTAKVEGGYTQESGRKAMQDVLQAAPDVHVVIGSTQAIAGAESVAKDKGLAFVGNGASRQAVRAVQEGRWFAIYFLRVKTVGSKAAELGLAKARGQQVKASNVANELSPNSGMGTKQALNGVAGEYDE